MSTTRVGSCRALMVFAWVVLLWGATLPNLQAAPSNDAFASRIATSGSTSLVTGSNIGATLQAGEPNHAGVPGGASVWWSWTAPSSGLTTISTAGSDFDTVLAVYTGTILSSLTPVASNDDDGPGLTSTVRFQAAAGVAYQIAVDGYGGSTGYIVLRTGRGVAPANDNFVSAPALRDLDYVLGGNELAGKESGEPLHASNSGGRSVWWQWTASEPGAVILTTEGSGFDTLLAVYVGNSVDNLTLVAQNDDALGTASEVKFEVSGGQTYRIAVDGYNGASGEIYLQNTFYPRPENDDFDDAFALLGLVVVDFGDSFAATKEPGEPDHAANVGGRSLWWRWVAPASGSVTVDTAGSEFDTLLAVYTGSSLDTLSLVAQNDDVGGGFQHSSVTWSAIAGVEYRIAVDGYRDGLNVVGAGLVQLNLAEAASPTIPVILMPPANTFGVAGGSAILTVSAAGSTPLEYQWQQDGRELAGATNSTLVLSNLQPTSAGTYAVVVNNTYGLTNSPAAALTVVSASGPVSWVALPFENDNSGAGPVATDAQGNIYVSGGFSGVLSFGPTNLTSMINPFGFSTDVFLACYTPEGRFVWVRHIGGEGTDIVGGIAVQPSGDVFIAGTFNGAAQFDSTTTITAPAVDHAYVACYQTNGVLRWVQAEVAGPRSAANALALSPWGDVYTTGRFEGTANFGGVILTSVGSGDVFLVKHRSTDGAVQWGVSAGNPSSGDSGNALAVWPGASPAEAAVYVGGYHSGSTVFSGLDGTGVTLQSVGGTGEFDGFVARFSGAGELNWVQPVGSSDFDSVDALAVDLNGNLICGGIFGAALFLNGAALSPFGGLDGFLAQVDASGVVNWVRAFGGGQYDDVDGVAIDGRNNIYATGTFHATAQFNGTNLTSSGNSEAFLAQYNNNGGHIGVMPMGGTGFDWSGGVATGPGGMILATGSFSDTASFGAINLTTTAPGSDHFYVARGASNSPANVPVIWGQPENLEVEAGNPVVFSIRFSGGPATFQWTHDGTAIPGATESALVIDPATLDDEGLYGVTIFTASGNLTSDAAFLTVNDTQIRVSIDVAPPFVDDQGNTRISITAFAENAQNFDSRLAIYEGDRLVFIRPFNTQDYSMQFGWSEPPLGTRCLRAVGIDQDEVFNPRTNSSSSQCVVVGPVSALGFASSLVSTVPFPPSDFGSTTVYGSVGIANQTGRASTPLRVRIQRNRSFFFLTSLPPADTPDPQEEFLNWQYDLPLGLAAGASVNVSIPSAANIVCPPWEDADFGSGFQYHIFAVLEEFVGGNWTFVDRTKLFSSIIRVWFPFNDGALGIDPLPTTNQFAFLTGLEILAPTNLVEGRTLNLIALGTLNDGATGAVNAAWSADLAGLSPEGLFQVPFVGAEQPVSVSATYQRRTTKTAMRVLNILDLGEPASLVVPPKPQVAIVGGQATFAVQAAGTGPLGYQWFFNATNAIPGGTGETLLLNNIQATQAGLYSVVVSNVLTAVTSAPVALTIVSQPALANPAFLAGGSFRFVINGQAGSQWEVQVSTDLKTWTTVSNLTLNGSAAEFLDPEAGGTPQRFFQLRSPEPP